MTGIINKLSWRTAVRLALTAAEIYGVKQRVYKSPIFGWTYTCVDHSGWDS